MSLRTTTSTAAAAHSAVVSSTQSPPAAAEGSSHPTTHPDTSTPVSGPRKSRKSKSTATKVRRPSREEQSPATPNAVVNETPQQATAKRPRGRPVKRQPTSKVSDTPPPAKRVKSRSSVSRSDPDREPEEHDSSYGGASSNRSLRDLTDHFPQIQAPIGRRLTRSVIRTLTGGSTENVADTPSPPLSHQSDRQSEQQQSNQPSTDDSASVEVVRVHRRKKKSASTASVAGGSRSSPDTASSSGVEPVKQETTSDEPRSASTGPVTRRQLLQSSSSVGVPHQHAPATATTGICQSIAREENRVFPGATASTAGVSSGGVVVPITTGFASGVTLNAAQQHHQAATTSTPTPNTGSAAGAGGGGGGASSSSGGGGAMSFGNSIRHPHQFLGQLVPRMQNLLGGHSQSNQRVNQMVEGMRAGGNEIRQSEAALELAEMLLMGNEESLPHLPTKEIVAALMQLLQKDHNPELMLTAVRCVTNLLEALPRAMPVVVECVPLLLEKLKSIDYIDVAEAALTALEVMSRRHGQKILSHGGIKATTSHLDFFSLQSQRVALQIAANCAAFVTPPEFNSVVKDCLPDLTQRLQLEDKRCLESVCTVFARLVENNKGSPDKLREIANHGLFQNLQSLLLVEPPAVGSQCFQSIIRLLRQLCTRCPDLAVTLVESGFARTLRLLIVGKDNLNSTDIELLNRPPQHLQELVLLTGELLPKLPTNGIFEVDQMMSRGQSQGYDTAVWYYKDDQEMLQPFAGFDSRVLEMAYQTRQREVTLQASGHVNTVNLERMIQIDEVEGSVRQVQRKTLPQMPNRDGSDMAIEMDARRQMLRNNTEAAEGLIRALFPVLVEIDGSSNGPAIRYDSLRTMLRMIEPSESKLLDELLKDLPLAQHIASALACTRSKDLCIVASALQIVHLITDKMPDVYVTLFRRQGVAHQIDKLALLPLAETPQPTPASSSSMLSAAARNNDHRWTRADIVSADSSLSSSSAVQMPPPSGLPPPPPPTSILRSSHGGSAPVLPSIVTAGQQHDAQPPPAKKKQPNEHAAASSSLVHTAVATRVDANALRKESRAGKRTSLMHSLKLPWANSGGGGASGSSKQHHHAAHDAASSSSSSSPGPSSDGAARGKAPHHLYHHHHSHTYAGGGAVPSAVGQPALVPRGPHTSGAPMTAPVLAGPGGGGGAYVGLPMGMRAMPAYSLPHGAGGGSGGALLSAVQKEKLRQWIKNEAKLLVDRFNEGMDTGDGGSDDSPLQRMSQAALMLHAPEDAHIRGQLIMQDDDDDSRSGLTLGGGETDALCALRRIFGDDDVSAFEVHHSGVVGALVRHLSGVNGQPPRLQRLTRFMQLFCGISEDNLQPMSGSERSFPFASLVSKVVAVVSQQEQFHVRTSDLLGSGLGGGGLMPTNLRGASALRFFQSHQIRCTLKRHADATELREWRHGHGTIKVDPFTPISAIERYLLDRGVAYPRSSTAVGDTTTSSGDDSNEATSDDDEVEENMELNTNPRERRLEILMGDRVMPSHVTVLQAIRQHQLHQAQQHAAASGGGVAAMADMDAMTLAAGIWINTHTMSYRLAAASVDDAVDTGAAHQAASSSSTAQGVGLSIMSSSGIVSGRRKASATKDRRSSKIDDKLWNEGQIQNQVDSLDGYLSEKLPLAMDDASSESLVLLRILYGLNRYWWSLYKGYYPLNYAPVVPLSSFVCAKLAAKVNRQLSDFLSVATQQLPSWVQTLANNVPFVLPFVTRRNLYYLTCFGRERALMHLANQGDGGPHHHNDGDAAAGRLTPRLERKKVSVKREDLLKQAEDILSRMGGSKAMLEVGFEGEVGTGYGPTLEFYSSVSKEIQKYSLRLWSGDKVEAPAEHSGGVVVEYVQPKTGLYPMAMQTTGGGRQRDAKLKKYDFLGKLMGQALMDGRMLDIPLNRAFYKWLLYQEREISFADMEALDQDLFGSMRRLLPPDETSAEDIEYMQLAFTMPGQDGFELVKYGNTKMVAKDNVRQYAELVAYWRLVEGVRREMDAVRKGLESVIETRHLSIFYPEEMDELFCGSSESGGAGYWETTQLRAALKPDHGYTHESVQIKWLIDWLSSLATTHQRKFLQFVTGSPRLPVGGFRSLSPLLTVVKKAVPAPDSDLPSAMTCYNYLKIPPYSSYDVFVAKFQIALEHVYSFYLT